MQNKFEFNFFNIEFRIILPDYREKKLIMNSYIFCLYKSIRTKFMQNEFEINFFRDPFLNPNISYLLQRFVLTLLSFHCTILKIQKIEKGEI